MFSVDIQVPADYVVNCIIAATAFNADKDRCSIYHSGTSHRNPLRWSYIVKCLLPYWLMVPNPSLSPLQYTLISTNTDVSINWPDQNPPKRRLERASFEFISGPYPMYEITYFLKWTLPAMLYQMLARTMGDEKIKKNAKLLGMVNPEILYL